MKYFAAPLSASFRGDAKHRTRNLENRHGRYGAAYRCHSPRPGYAKASPGLTVLARRSFGVGGKRGIQYTAASPYPSLSLEYWIARWRRPGMT
jgi:hypothetical protein